MPLASTSNPDSLLPLPAAVFHILMALAGDDLHGYAIMEDVAARSGNRLRLGPGTLYRSLQRMLEQGLIVETSQRPDPSEDDERRRYYRLTAFGDTVARAETSRLSDLMKMARASGFAPASSAKARS